MFKKIIVSGVLCSLLISYSPSASAVTKLTLAEQAVQNTKCIEPNKYSLAKTGPLICSKGIWKVVPASQDTVATRAYRSLLTRYNRMPDSAPNLIVRADPKAGEWKNKIVKGFIAAARLWGTSTSQDQALPLYISENAQFISENLAKDGLRESPEDAQRNKEAAARGGGQAGSHGSYFDFIFSEQSSHDTGFYQVGPHEYTHHAQRILSHTRTPQLPREFWLEEGCATFVGTSMGGLIGNPQNQRDSTVQHIRGQVLRTDLSRFTRGTQDAYSDPRFNEIYDNAAMACEAIVAVAGIDSIEALYRGVANEGDTFESATLMVYRMRLDSLVKFGQCYLDSVRLGKTLSLAALKSKFAELQEN